MRKTIVLADFRKQTVNEAIQGCRPWLEQNLEIFAWCKDPTELKGLIAQHTIDYLLVFGGDGLILSTARQLNGYQVPVLGVNFGKLGFLAEVAITELTENIEQILQGNYRIAERMMLMCEIIRNDNIIYSTVALNDGVIRIGHSSRMLYCRLSIDHEEVCTYGGDGVIISTPVGSTAYSLSAGGPVLSPTLSAFVISPICAHILTMRPLVVPAEQIIEIRFLHPYSGDAIFSADGQVDFELQENDRIKITQAPKKFYLLETGRRSFFKILQEKMAWGEVRAKI